MNTDHQPVLPPDIDDDEIVVNSSATTMGSPVPNGWNQPTRWPGRLYKDLRPAVQHLYDGVCQRCGFDGRAVTKISNADPKTPENLILICHTCLGSRLQWEPDDKVRLRDLAIANADMIRRMTGFGIQVPKRAPRKPVRKIKSVGRPSKDDESKKSIPIKFRISPQELQSVRDGRLRFNANRYARDRFLRKKNTNVYQKRDLNKVGVNLKTSKKTLEVQNKTARTELKHIQASVANYIEGNEKHPLVAAFLAQQSAIATLQHHVDAHTRAMNDTLSAMIATFNDL